MAHCHEVALISRTCSHYGVIVTSEELQLILIEGDVAYGLVYILIIEHTILILETQAIEGAIDLVLI